MATYWLYITASKSRVLYVGVTNDLVRRIWEHKNHVVKGFTARYHVDRLVYFEEASDVLSAIAREKEIKGWVRKKKVALIESVNPKWKNFGLEITG